MARWVFVRHGQSVANAAGWLSGHRDVPLTELGKEQARNAGAQLEGIAFAAAWSSDLQRAVQTAELILGGRDLPLRQHPALRERNLGSYEGQLKAELRADGRMDCLLEWDGKPPGGESHRDLALRALPVLVEFPDVPTLIVSHGGMMRTLVGLLDQEPLDEMGRVWVKNCEPETREVRPGDWQQALDRVHATLP